MKDKTITIDDLARMINAGFNDVTNDISEVKRDMARSSSAWTGSRTCCWPSKSNASMSWRRG
jgi:hypothetical protein